MPCSNTVSTLTTLTFCHFRGFTCTNRNGNTCKLMATSTTAVTTAMCSGSQLVSLAMQTFPRTVVAQGSEGSTVPGSTVMASETAPMMLLAPMFQLNFKQTDLPQPTTQPTVQPTIQPTIGGQSKSQLNSASARRQNGGIPTSAQIVLGVGGFLIICISLYTIIGYQNRTRASKKMTKSKAINGRHRGRSELAPSHSATGQAGDGKAVVPFEVDGSQPRLLEMDGRRSPVELPDSTPCLRQGSSEVQTEHRTIPPAAPPSG